MMYIINVIVSGLVLLNVAGTITDLIAQYGLGTRSLIYRSHMIEETNFERESRQIRRTRHARGEVLQGCRQVW